MSQKIRILLLGSAFAADLHADAYSRIRERIEIVGIASNDKAQAHDLMSRYNFSGHQVITDFEEAIAVCECDVVDICLPNFLHHPAAMAATNHKRHVICEKPLATTVQAGREMIKAAKDAGIHIYYAEDWMGSPALTKTRSIIAEGAIGELKFIRAHEAHSGSHSPFVQKVATAGGGAMIHLGAHPITFALALHQNRWTELVAMTSGGGVGNLIHHDLEGEDWAATLISFEDGSKAILEANFVTYGGMEDSLDLYGTKGCLHVDLTFSSPIHGFSIPGFDYTVEKAEITTGWARPVVDEKYNLGYVAELAIFIDCLEKGIEAPIGLRGIDGLETLEVIDLIYESSRTGKKVVNPKRGQWK
jgi:myo-inositol 2-dehydrogenase/D-chiro-inositol 1-dehydrogenase